MFHSVSGRRSVVAVAQVVFSAVFLASAAAARANATYNIVNYPTYESDQANGQVDSISGTLVTDGKTGRHVRCRGGDPLHRQSQPGRLQHARRGQRRYHRHRTGFLTALTIPAPVAGSSNGFFLTNFLDTGPSDGTLALRYDRGASDIFQGLVIPSSSPPFCFTASTSSPATLTLTHSDPWLIATAAAVPEPATLTLLCSALPGRRTVLLLPAAGRRLGGSPAQGWPSGPLRAHRWRRDVCFTQRLRQSRKERGGPSPKPRFLATSFAPLAFV